MIIEYIGADIRPFGHFKRLAEHFALLLQHGIFKDPLAQMQVGKMQKLHNSILLWLHYTHLFAPAQSRLDREIQSLYTTYQ